MLSFSHLFEVNFNRNSNKAKLAIATAGGVGTGLGIGASRWARDHTAEEIAAVGLGTTALLGAGLYGLKKWRKSQRKGSK